jgi:hypothetical protein
MKASLGKRLSMKKTILGGLMVALVSFSCAGMQIPDSKSQEARLFSKKCSLCHGLPHPSRHSRREWNHYLNLMKGNMDKKNISYTESEINTIRSYLHRYAKGTRL